MASITGLKQKKANADSLSQVGWNGANGIGAMVTDASDLLLERGVMPVATTALLALIGAADARIALVPGVAMYVYNSSSSGTNSALDIPANGGGRWQFVVALTAGAYAQVIGNSTAGTTSFTIAHGLETDFPTILIEEPSAPGGTSGYVLRSAAEVGATISRIDKNNTLVDFGATVPASAQYTIIAKK